MLISDKVKTTWSSRNKNRYVELGYKFTKMGGSVDVRVEHLSRGSHAIVDVKCDYCGIIKNVPYKQYIYQHDDLLGDSCSDCKLIKSRITMSNKYGVDNPSKLDWVKEKKIDTCMNNFGVEHPMQSKDVRDKAITTNVEKYGVEHPSQSNVVKTKIVNTNNEKYGVDWTRQNKDIDTKIKSTMNVRYGGNSPFCNEEVRDKAKSTFIEKYGVDNPLKDDGIRHKCREAMYNNGTVPTSSQQLKVYDTLVSMFGNCEINYPVSNLSLDCMVIIDGCAIDVEYDGWHWHKDKQNKDRRRDEVLKEMGYKIIRIKANRDVPTVEQLDNAIDYLVKGNHSYTEIILDV